MATSPLIVDNLPVLTVKDCQQADPGDVSIADHQLFLPHRTQILSRRYYLQSLLLRCQGRCGREPFAISVLLAVQPDFSWL
ncbi:hypothetical protein T4B_14542 [Trichinella pseudospiralis]|uniref:Uncharacterized protein n=1 Tax=Trichinella pseudospiralis TaxID=6337 RepID=A0A0V1H9S4_TRIPS|nr:hypothetical protein T4B_14542 [Trichinella pseudospiralis]KRZ28877.1 hypothetical protein T4C_6830 [Trichinella pseudospiralis]